MQHKQFEKENQHFFNHFSMCQKASLQFVQSLLNCCRSTASNKIKEARDALAKKPHQILSEKEFLKYYDIIV